LKLTRAALRLPSWHPGFTIIELAVVLVILSVLALSVLPVAELSVRRAKERELKSALWDIRKAIDAYKHDFDSKALAPGGPISGYPESLSILVDGVDDAVDSSTKHYYLRRIARDPFTDSAVPDEQSWGLRSYASPPDHPQSGDDVYDVYSRDPGIGLNGIEYSKW